MIYTQIGIDLSSQKDFTSMCESTAMQIYSEFNIPEAALSEVEKDSEELFREWLKINRIVIYQEGR